MELQLRNNWKFIKPLLKTRQLTSKTTYLNPVSANPTKWSNTLKVNNNVIAVEEITLIKNN